MNRRVLLTLAVAAMAFSTSTAFAGGSSKSQTQYVRIKNIGSLPAYVFVANGEITLPAWKAGNRLLSQNAVTQFVLKKGASEFGVLSDNDTGSFGGEDFLKYNFPNSTYVYLQARVTAGGVSQASFAPPGTRF